MNTRLIEEKRSPSKKRLRANSPTCRGKDDKSNNKNKQSDDPGNIQKNPYEIYFRSDLGQNFIQQVSKTEQIRENLSTFVAEMDEKVTQEFTKTKANVKEK